MKVMVKAVKFLFLTNIISSTNAFQDDPIMKRMAMLKADDLVFVENDFKSANMVLWRNKKKTNKGGNVENLFNKRVGDAEYLSIVNRFDHRYTEIMKNLIQILCAEDNETRKVLTHKINEVKSFNMRFFDKTPIEENRRSTLLLLHMALNYDFKTLISDKQGKYDEREMDVFTENLNYICLKIDSSMEILYGLIEKYGTLDCIPAEILNQDLLDKILPKGAMLDVSNLLLKVILKFVDKKTSDRASVDLCKRMIHCICYLHFFYNIPMHSLHIIHNKAFPSLEFYKVLDLTMERLRMCIKNEEIKSIEESYLNTSNVNTEVQNEDRIVSVKRMGNAYFQEILYLDQVCHFNIIDKICHRYFEELLDIKENPVLTRELIEIFHREFDKKKEYDEISLMHTMIRRFDDKNSKLSDNSEKNTETAEPNSIEEVDSTLPFILQLKLNAAKTTGNNAELQEKCPSFDQRFKKVCLIKKSYLSAPDKSLMYINITMMRILLRDKLGVERNILEEFEKDFLCLYSQIYITSFRSQHPSKFEEIASESSNPEEIRPSEADEMLALALVCRIKHMLFRNYLNKRIHGNRLNVECYKYFIVCIDLILALYTPLICQDLVPDDGIFPNFSYELIARITISKMQKHYRNGDCVFLKAAKSFFKRAIAPVEQDCSEAYYCKQLIPAFDRWIALFGIDRKNVNPSVGIVAI